MRERVNQLLIMMGLELNTIQVVEEEGHSNKLMFPNYMTETTVNSWINDAELLNVMIT